MTARHPRGDAAAGFTLIEVVVALALVGLVSLLLLYGVGLAGRGLDRLSHHGERLDERRSLELMLRRALQSAAPIAVFDGEPGFVGRPAAVSFLSVVDDGGPGLHRIMLAFDPAQPAAGVRLSRRPAGRSAPPGRSDSVLVRRVRSFSIGYFGAASPGDEPRWHHAWEGLAHLPQLVRIILDADDGDTHPPIVLRLPSAG
jgi:general secretion pathway protein J